MFRNPEKVYRRGQQDIKEAVCWNSERLNIIAETSQPTSQTPVRNPPFASIYSAANLEVKQWQNKLKYLTYSDDPIDFDLSAR